MKRGPYKKAPDPGSIGDLILRYRKSPRFLGWAPSTRKKFDKILADLMDQNARMPVAELRRGDIIAARDEMAHIPGEANNWLKVVRGMLDYAVDLEMIPFNPAARIKKLAPKHPDGFRTWREDEIEAFLRYWPKGSLPHLAVTLALYTGAARDDLVRLGWQNVEGERIAYRRKKTGVRVSVPILPPLAELLKVLPQGRMTFLETKAGTVRSAAGMAAHLLLWLKKAGLDGKDTTGHRLSFHGLRKALGVRLADAGCSSRQIAAILGQVSPRSAEVYTREYDRERAADEGAEKMQAMMPDRKVTRIGNGSRPNRKRPA